MKPLIVAVGLLLAQLGTAAAANLNCWNTTTIRTNNSPSGTYRITTTSSVDYIQPYNDGVATLFSGLSAFNSGGFAICLEGSSTYVSNKKVWRVTAATICYLSRVANNTCQG